MRLYQIPFSHNCIKVRHVLGLKGADFEVSNINPAIRGEVKRRSGPGSRAPRTWWRVGSRWPTSRSRR